MPNHSFEIVAPYYDWLAQLVFGDKLRRAQAVYLSFIPAGSPILIIGGGSGWILEKIVQSGNNYRIVYLEASPHMLAQARNLAVPAGTHVEFRLGTEENISPGERFGVVITNFFLDLFAPAPLRAVLTVLNRSLIPGGLWLATDFVQPTGFTWRSWQAKVMLKSMYWYFRLTCGISARSLPAWENELLALGLELQKSAYFYGGFLHAVLLRKPN